MKFGNRAVVMLKALSESKEAGGEKPVPGVADGEYIGYGDIARFVRRSVLTLVSSVAISLMAGFAYVLTTPPTFTARAQLLIDPQIHQPLQDPTAYVNFSLDNPQVESQIAVLRSEKIAHTVIEKLDLSNDPELLGMNGSGLIPASDDPAIEYERSRVGIAAFQGALDVRRVATSYAIDISFSSRDPEKAARIANALAEAYVQDQLSTRADAARQGSEWLEGRIDGLRQLMNEAALKVQQFKVKRDYRVIGPRAQGEGGAPSADGPRDAAAPEAEARAARTLEELESTAAAYRKIFESYLQAYTESVQRQSFPVANARVITPATRPLAKSHPKTTLLLALAGLVGVLAGAGIALVRHNLGHPPHGDRARPPPGGRINE